MASTYSTTSMAGSALVCPSTGAQRRRKKKRKIQPVLVPHMRYLCCTLPLTKFSMLTKRNKLYCPQPRLASPLAAGIGVAWVKKCSANWTVKILMPGGGTSSLPYVQTDGPSVYPIGKFPSFRWLKQHLSDMNFNRNSGICPPTGQHLISSHRITSPYLRHHHIA